MAKRGKMGTQWMFDGWIADGGGIKETNRRKNDLQNGGGQTQPKTIEKEPKREVDNINYNVCSTENGTAEDRHVQGPLMDATLG